MFYTTVSFSVEESCRALNSAKWTPHDLLALSDDEATALFVELRYPETNGRPWCPKCLSTNQLARATSYRCRNCKTEHRPTTDTCFFGSRMSHQCHLALISCFGQRKTALYSIGDFVSISGLSHESVSQWAKKLQSKRVDAGLKRHFAKRAWQDPFWGRLITTIYEMRDKAVGKFQAMSEAERNGYHGKQLRDAIEFGDDYLLSTFQAEGATSGAILKFHRHSHRA